MAKYEKVGSGQFGVYRKKPAGWAGVIGGIAVVLIVLAVIGNLAG